MLQRLRLRLKALRPFPRKGIHALGKGRRARYRCARKRTRRCSAHGAIGWEKIVSVGNAVAVRIGGKGVGAFARFFSVGKPVAVGISREGARAARKLLLIRKAVTVGIGIARVGPKGRFLRVGDAVIVVIRILVVAKFVAIGIGVDREAHGREKALFLRWEGKRFFAPEGCTRHFQHAHGEGGFSFPRLPRKARDTARPRRKAHRCRGNKGFVEEQAGDNLERLCGPVPQGRKNFYFLTGKKGAWIGPEGRADDTHRCCRGRNAGRHHSHHNQRDKGVAAFAREHSIFTIAREKISRSN